MLDAAAVGGIVKGGGVFAFANFMLDVNCVTSV